MDIVIRRCCGLDVHKQTISACVIVAEEGKRKAKHQRGFGTTTGDLRELRAWLKEHGVTDVAMESTGVYWKPVWNILENFFTLVLVNARHIKIVPGRKTDVKDAEWIANLLQHGLIQGSFVPPRAIRDLRDLTRYRATLMQEMTSITNRIQKVLEDANVKLASVASDVLGVSGRQMLEAIISGVDDPELLAQMARRRMRSKMEQLRAALEGLVQDHHRFLLRQLLDNIDFLERKIEELDSRIEQQVQPYQTVVEKWMQIPGIQKITAWSLLAEIGPDMSQFPTAHHLASWAGLCPGNNESAGKRGSGKTRKGSVWLRRSLSQAAWAASHTKQTYLASRFKRLAAKRGGKRAIIALAHKLLLLGYYLIRRGLDYKDLGSNYFDSLQADRLRRYLVTRLEQLGHAVTLSAAPTV